MEAEENSCKATVTFLHEQVSALKTHYGQECDAKTVLQLLRMCPPLRTSVHLLLQELSPPPLLVARASSVLEQLTNCTRDLHRGGGIQVRDNNEVWQDIVSAVESIVSTVLQCMHSWLQKRQSELHNRLTESKRSLENFKKEAPSKASCKNEMYVLIMAVIEKISAALKGIHQWKSFVPEQRRKILDVWLKQLYTVIQLLPRVAVLMVSLQDNSTSKLSPSSFISLNVVIARLEEIIDEIINATSLKFDDVFSEGNTSFGNDCAPGAFLTAVDKVLELLFSVRDRKLRQHNSRSMSSDQNTLDAATKSFSNLTKSPIGKSKSSSTSSTLMKSLQKQESIRNDSTFNSSEKRNNCCEASYEPSTVTKTDGGTLLPNDDVTSPVGQLVKVPLEEILRHVISIAYCSSPSDNKTIMSLCEEVLAHLKQLVNVESSESVSSGQVADHAVACEWLAESIERLEQCAHTALIRCYVRTFADVTLPLNRLLHAVQSTVCSSTTLEQNPSSTLPVVQELIADLDEHVDAIFQLAGLAAASSTDQSRSSSVRSCLLTLEWLESVLVPVLLQSCSPSSLAATLCAKKHAQLLADHWRDAAVALRQCLDASLDPAAFVMVTQSEVHAAWWLLKQKLYCRDVEAVLEPVTRVLGLTERLSHLHESDAFMVQEQREQLHRATDELQRSMKAVSTAPENLRMRRSLLKRVQLMLTVVTRLSSSLHSTTLRDHTVLRHPMRPNVVERPVLSAATHELAVAQGMVLNNKTSPYNDTEVSDSGDRSWVATSDIADIPVDVATPFRNLHRSSLRGRNPFSVNQSSLGKDSTTASSARSVSQQLVERTSYQSSREEPCADVREVTARGPTASCVTQTNEVTRSSSKSNSARSANDKVTALDPSRAVPASSSFLSNHAVVEHTDDQLLNLSAILMNKKITSSIRPNCNDSDVEPPSTFVTNFNHLKSINCTFGSVCNDTTLDITRLLASNTMDPAIRSSIRASVRSRLLRSLRGKNQSSVVKELSVDLSTIISPAVGTGTSKLPPRPARAAPHSDASVQQVSRNDAGARVCDGSVSADLQRSQSELQLLKSSSLVQDITGLIENLSTFANNFSSSCTTVRPLQSSDVSAQEKPVTASEGSCVGESCVLSDLNDFSSFDCRTSGEHRTCMSRKVDLHSDDAEMLRGIRLHGVSFSPQFPCIESMKTISVSSASSGNESGGKENIDFKATSEKKDFTALSNTKSPCEIKMLNFSKNTFNSTQIMTSVIHEAQDIFSEPTALADLSESSLGSERTPTLSADVTEVVAIQTQRSPLRDLNSNAPNDTASKKQVKFSFNVDLGNASDSMSARNDLDVSSNYKTVSFKSSVASITTPDSVDVDIPQRLLDLQTLRTKLCKLKSMFRL